MKARYRAFLAGLFFSMAFSAPAAAQTTQEPVTIDVLVAYTEKAEHLLAKQYNNRAIQDDLLLVEALQNRIFENTNLNVRVRFVIEKLNFDEDKDPVFSAACSSEKTKQSKLLCHIAENSTGVVDPYGVNSLRKKHKADVVSLIMWVGGWYDEGSVAQRKLTKQVFQAKDAARAAYESYMTLVLAEKSWIWWHFAHEFGHVLGLADSDDSEDDLINADAYGYSDTDYPFRTIMAYKNDCNEQTMFGNCPRIPVYSTVDPSVTFFGRPVGRKGADAAKTIKETAPFVATYDQFLK